MFSEPIVDELSANPCFESLGNDRRERDSVSGFMGGVTEFGRERNRYLFYRNTRKCSPV